MNKDTIVCDRHAEESGKILARLDSIDDTLVDIKKSLYGNGRPGLSDRTLSLEIDVSGQKKLCETCVSDRKSTRRWAVSTLVLVLISVGGFLGTKFYERIATTPASQTQAPSVAGAHRLPATGQQ